MSERTAVEDGKEKEDISSLIIFGVVFGLLFFVSLIVSEYIWGPFTQSFLASGVVIGRFFIQFMVLVSLFGYIISVICLFQRAYRLALFSLITGIVLTLASGYAIHNISYWWGSEKAIHYHSVEIGYQDEKLLNALLMRLSFQNN